jgi:hypothetical protein
MKNEKNITIQDLEKCYRAVVWDSCDKITNLSDGTVGYYAYKLQELLLKKSAYEVNEALKDNSVLISKMLEQIAFPMDELAITYKGDEWNMAKEYLDNLETNLEQKEKIKSNMGEEKFSEMISKYKESAKTPMILHQFELFFRIWHNGVGFPVVLRNGYLLKCLKDADIQFFEELDEYEAVLIYNSANVNGHICSFVKFQKKKSLNN